MGVLVGWEGGLIWGNESATQDGIIDGILVGLHLDDSQDCLAVIDLGIDDAGYRCQSKQ